MGTLISDAFNSETLVKILIALSLSLVIGIEREIKKKPIGFKTSAVIATFSCLLTVISIEAAYLVPARDDINVTMDPLRLAAQIVSGIGFLGAGAILRKDNDNITGLTTAAMIWGSASIGIAVGAGFYIEAAFAVLSIMLIIEIVAPAFAKFGPQRLRQKELSITAVIYEHEMIPLYTKHLEQLQIKIENIRVKQVNIQDTTYHKLYIKVSAPPEHSTLIIYNELLTLAYIHSIEVHML